jgi:tRNA1(Val) A37 N6-methylase TrmN6
MYSVKASCLLADFIRNTNRILIDGVTNVIELGSGCGLAGIVALRKLVSRQARAKVLLTDCDFGVLEQLKANILLNQRYVAYCFILIYTKKSGLI